MRLLAALCVLFAAAQASAGCPKVFVKQAVAYPAVAYVPVYQPQYYQVGPEIRQEAIIEAAVSKALSRFQATTVTERTITTTSVGGQATTQVQSAGQFGRCAKCHTGAAAKGDFRVDAELSCEDRLRAIGALLHDDPVHRMPKGVELPADELGRLIQSFASGLPARAAAVPPPEPVPPAPIQ